MRREGETGNYGPSHLSRSRTVPRDDDGTRVDDGRDPVGREETVDAGDWRRAWSLGSRVLSIRRSSRHCHDRMCCRWSGAGRTNGTRRVGSPPVPPAETLDKGGPWCETGVLPSLEGLCESFSCATVNRQRGSSFFCFSGDTTGSESLRQLKQVRAWMCGGESRLPLTLVVESWR